MVELSWAVSMSLVYQYGTAGGIRLRNSGAGRNLFSAASGICLVGVDSNLAVSGQTRISSQGSSIYLLCILSDSFACIGIVKIPILMKKVAL